MALSSEHDSEPVNPGDFEQVAGFEALHASTLKCIKGVLWKDTPAHYFLNNLEENLVLERQLQNGKYKQKKPKKFKVYYPKERDIVSVHFRDRVFQPRMPGEDRSVSSTPGMSVQYRENRHHTHIQGNSVSRFSLPTHRNR